MVLVYVYPQFKGHFCLLVYIPVVTIFVIKLVLLSRDSNYSTALTFFEKKNQKVGMLLPVPFSFKDFF